MANLVVIYDTDKEMAAIVDTDDRMGWGPAMVGPDAADILQGFIQSIPFDVRLLSSHDAVSAFQQWIEVLAAAAAQPPATPPEGALEPLGDQPVDPGPPDRTGPADGGADPPEPAPADTDMEAGHGAPPQVTTCPLCTGAGVTSDGADRASVTCAMCGGAKVVRMAVPS